MPRLLYITMLVICFASTVQHGMEHEQNKIIGIFPKKVWTKDVIPQIDNWRDLKSMQAVCHLFKESISTAQLLSSYLGLQPISDEHAQFILNQQSIKVENLEEAVRLTNPLALFSFLQQGHTYTLETDGYRGWTLLHYAAAAPYSSCLQLLFNHTCPDKSQECVMIKSADRLGGTPLCIAVINSKIDNVRYLLSWEPKRNLDRHTDNNGNSLFDTINDNRTVLELLGRGQKHLDLDLCQQLLQDWLDGKDI